MQFIAWNAHAASPRAAEGLRLAGLTLPPRGEQVCWREDGSSFPAEYEVGPIVKNGRRTGAVLTFRDVSERRASERLKEEVIGVVSHELRSPLTSIRSALGLLATGSLVDLPEPAQRMLDIAVTNSDRLIRLVGDLLDLERIDKGQLALIRATRPVADLMTGAADAIRSLAEEAGITLKVAPSSAVLWADPDRVQQVLINLLGNAIKFSPSGSTVWLDAENTDSELIFRVRDQGHGIPSDKLETIFDRFAQVANADSRDHRGTGLGLAISRGIVRQHGGEIWAESTLGVGTTMFVALPADATPLRITELHGDNSMMAA
jgi:signal transduction histidine kinase